MQPFLTANWRYLAMLNYTVDPRLLAPLVPPGTEIDFENGETFLSVVGFLFLDTRLLGLPNPLHRDFEEVNLRFYVKRKSADTWRRGVVFIRELVPRHAHRPRVLRRKLSRCADDTRDRTCRFRRESGIFMATRPQVRITQESATGQPQSIPAGSHAEFISEHYWGYTSLRSGCGEYRVEHPRWKIWNASEFGFTADVATLYGEQFIETLNQPPRSAFIAYGSPITVHRRELL